ncbi:MAG: FIST N-terminal domain-containing protein [Pirellulaceae bacterium]
MAALFASAVSTQSDWREAVRDVCGEVCDAIGSPPDLAVLFVSADRAAECDALARQAAEQLGGSQLIGCTGESIVGVRQEIEGASAVSLWAAKLAETTIRTMHLKFERSSEGGVIVGWPDDLPEPWPEGAALLLLGDPFSFPADALMERLNEDRPGVPVIGGMSSGGAAPGENRLLLGDGCHAEGAVVAMIHGGVRVRSLVSQGCRPIGTHLVVTKAERNVIHELGGRPALLRLKELFDTLPTREQEMVQRGLHVGRVVSEYQDHFQQGDFLVRNVMGIDPDNGSIAMGDYIRAGQTVQFHIRDANSADQELRQLLSRAKADAAPAGALLFTCNGRGTRLFPEPHHDASAIADALGEIPLAGFFAAGELGPVAGENFMHGFTASLALFETR